MFRCEQVILLVVRFKRAEYWDANRFFGELVHLCDANSDGQVERVWSAPSGQACGTCPWISIAVAEPSIRHFGIPNMIIVWWDWLDSPTWSYFSSLVSVSFCKSADCRIFGEEKRTWRSPGYSVQCTHKMHHFDSWSRRLLTSQKIFSENNTHN